MSYENNALWYVVHTYSGYENKVAANIEKIVENRGLQNLILETKIPTEIVVNSEAEAQDYLKVVAAQEDPDFDEEIITKKPKRAPKEKKPEEHKLFPSYVLIRMVMNDESWHVIRNIRGVTGFVGPGSKPVPLSEDEVAALGVELRVRKTDFNIGDSIIVVAGLLAGSIATVKEINNETGRIKVIAMFGGKESVVELNADEVELLNS